MKNKKRIKAIAIASCCAALTAAVMILYSNSYSWFNGARQAGIVMNLDGDAEEWDTSGLSGGAKTGGTKIPGYEVVRFPKGARDVELPLVNPEENNCYFAFELILDSTGEQLYESGLVEPGKAVSKITLTRALDEGEYRITIRVKPYDMQSMAALNGANVQAKLYVI